PQLQSPASSRGDQTRWLRAYRLRRPAPHGVTKLGGTTVPKHRMSYRPRLRSLLTMVEGPSSSSTELLDRGSFVSDVCHCLVPSPTVGSVVRLPSEWWCHHYHLTRGD